MRKRYITLNVILVLMAILIFVAWVNNSSDANVVNKDVVNKNNTPVSEERNVDFEKYNIDYINDGVRNILVKRMKGAKTDFYLPPTNYVNVSRGTKYGVALVIQNVNPKVPEGNRFDYNFDVDVGSLASCGVSEEEGQSWIERGWGSNGVIGGQWREDWNEWYDSMTIYFSFPADLEPCMIKYDFEIRKDGEFYDSRTLEFNLI